jgi:hypothetical protein
VASRSSTTVYIHATDVGEDESYLSGNNGTGRKKQTIYLFSSTAFN